MNPALFLLALSSFAFAEDKIKVLETKTISQQPEYYNGWPTLARKQDGTLMVAVSGGRHGHVCPFGRVEWMTSRDDGATWTFPRTILDTDMDDRDAGVLETPKGTLLVTTFTSTAYLIQLDLLKAGKPSNFVNETTLPAWLAAHARLTDEQRKAQLGEWVVRSTDGGLSWSPPIRTLVNSPHGPTALSDGRLLYVGKELWSEKKRIGVSESTDDGLTWRWLAEIPARPSDNVTEDYHELHAVQASSGRIIAHIRHHGKPNTKETLQTESDDGGKTWNEPHSIGVWGYPSHLLKLRDGSLLMSYGHRRKPIGNQARISRDNGQTWSAPLIISGEADSGDLGYPSTVELADGSLVTVWYEKMKDSTNAVLRQARWTLEK
ncbi:MAG: sialidase family protein [Prosthecobacter sp.]